MFSAKELDIVSDQVGTMSMPEIFYGYNHLYVVRTDKDLLLEFSPIDTLKLAAFDSQKIYYKEKSKAQDELSKQLEEELHIDSEIELNRVDMIPQRIEVKEAQFWKHKDTSKVKDFKQIEIISDWTYSSTFKGSVRYLSKHSDRIKNETSLEIKASEEAKKNEEGGLKIIREQTEGIPFERLGRENPILHFGEVLLYEDDLGDQGYTQCSLRFRVMGDCFYVLLRYYLRVDEVIVRIFDTRIFHSYDTNYIIREFKHQESTYDQLRNKEFKITSEWGLSKTQSDEVAQHLDLKFKTLDKVIF